VQLYPTQLSKLFQLQSKVIGPLLSHFCVFCYIDIVEIVLVLIIAKILLIER